MTHLISDEEMRAGMARGEEDLRRDQVESTDKPPAHDHAYRDLMKVNGEYQTERSLVLDGS
jgi:hypothetical protein